MEAYIETRMGNYFTRKSGVFEMVEDTIGAANDIFVWFVAESPLIGEQASIATGLLTQHLGNARASFDPFEHTHSKGIPRSNVKRVIYRFIQILKVVDSVLEHRLKNNQKRTELQALRQKFADRLDALRTATVLLQ